MTSQVVWIILIMFKKQYIFHYLHVYKFDWMCKWCQALWKIMSLKINLVFLESKKLDINFKLWLCSEFNNQCRNVILYLISLQIASETQTENNLIVWIFLQDAYQDIVVALAVFFMTCCIKIQNSEFFLISAQFQYHISLNKKTTCQHFISWKH